MKSLWKIMFSRRRKLHSEEQIRKRIAWSFVVFVGMTAVVIAAWLVLVNQPLDHGRRGVQKPLRKVLNANETVFDGLLDKDHAAETYPRSRAVEKATVNGMLGLRTDLPEDWKLMVLKSNGDTLYVSLEEIKQLPKTEYTFNFKCIEGWSEISNWGGVRFSDFAQHYGLEEETAKKYLGLATPDSGYYVGIDIPSAMHPQTILCYEHNGKPLPLKQGYPLRLMIPVKYGVKSLKRIGTMYFSDSQPPDYWAERGYDYYLGL